MTRVLSPPILLVVVAVPVVGWFAGGWAGGTTLRQGTQTWGRWVSP